MAERPRSRGAAAASLLIKVFLGERVDPDCARELLERYRAEVEERRAHFAALVAATPDGG